MISTGFPSLPSSIWSWGTARHLLLHKAGDPGQSPPVPGRSHSSPKLDLQNQQEGANEAWDLELPVQTVGDKGREVAEFGFHK